MGQLEESYIVYIGEYGKLSFIFGKSNILKNIAYMGNMT